MAFPSIRSQTTTSESGNTTSHTITYPSSISAGDTLLCFIGCDGDNTFDWAAAESSRGWVKLFETSNGTATALSVGYIKASGSESGSFELSSSSSERSANRIFAIQDAEDPDVAPPVPSTANLSTGTSLPFNDVFPSTAVGDFHYNSTSGIPYGQYAVQEKWAIEIGVTGSDFDVENVLVKLSKFGNPTDNTLVKIFTDNGGEPSTTQVGGTGTIDNSTLSTATVGYVISLAATLTASTTYWLEISRSGSVDEFNYPEMFSESAPTEAVQVFDDTGPGWGNADWGPFFELRQGGEVAADYLWFIGVGYDDDDGGMFGGGARSYPTGYTTNGQYDISNTGAGTGSLDTSYRTNNAIGESPDNGAQFTSEESVKVVIGVFPIGPTPLTLHSYRFRADDGVEATGGATFIYDDELSITVGQASRSGITLDENVRFRCLLDEENVENPDASTIQLRASLNGGAFFDVNGSSNVVRMSVSPHFASGDPTTDHGMSVPAGTFVAGEMDETDGLTGSIDMAQNQYTIVEYCFQIRSVDVVGDDVIEFALRHNGLDSHTTGADAFDIHVLPYNIHSRVRADDGGEGTGGATFIATQDENITVGSGQTVEFGATFRIRILLEELDGVTNTNAPAGNLVYRVNGGALTVAIESQGSTAGRLRMSASSEFTDEDPTTDHGMTVTATGSFVVGEIDQVDPTFPSDYAVSADEYLIHEWSIEAYEPQWNDGDVVVFEMNYVRGPVLANPEFLLPTTLTSVFETDKLGVADVDLVITVADVDASVEHPAAATETLSLTTLAVGTRSGIRLGVATETLALTISADALVEHSAAVSETLQLTTAAAGSRSRIGVASESLVLTASAPAEVVHSAVVAETLVLTVVAVGLTNVVHSGEAAELLVITVVANASVEHGATASVALSLTVAAPASVELVSTAAETLALTVAAVTSVDRATTAGETLAITVSAQAAIAHDATASETLVLTVLATPTKAHSAVASETLQITTSALASVEHAAAAAESLTIIVPASLGQPVNFLVPISDVSAGNWEDEGGATVNLFQSIDEGEPGSTSDFIINVGLPDTVEVRLTSSSDPTSAEYHVVQFTAEKNNVPISIDLDVELREGASTVIASFSITTTQAEVLYQYRLSTAEANSITDYTDLRIRWTASVT